MVFWLVFNRFSQLNAFYPSLSLQVIDSKVWMIKKNFFRPISTKGVDIFVIFVWKMSIFVVFLHFRHVRWDNRFQGLNINSVHEIWHMSPTLMIFWCYMCRFPEMFVVEAVGLRKFHTLYIKNIASKKIFSIINSFFCTFF